MAHLGIVNEEDILTTINEADLTASLGFLRDTIQSFGTEDVAEYLRHKEGRGDITDDDVLSLAQRLDAALRVLEG